MKRSVIGVVVLALSACGGSGGRTTPTTTRHTTTPTSAADAALTDAVARDVQDGAIALNCDFCDPDKLYAWLIVNRGYPGLAQPDVRRRVQAECERVKSSQATDPPRTDLALFLIYTTPAGGVFDSQALASGYIECAK